LFTKIFVYKQKIIEY